MCVINDVGERRGFFPSLMSFIGEASHCLDILSTPLEPGFYISRLMIFASCFHVLLNYLVLFMFFFLIQNKPVNAIQRPLFFSS